MRFSKELYSKVALIKAAYNFTDRAYVHLDADQHYYYVTVEAKQDEKELDETEFEIVENGCLPERWRAVLSLKKNMKKKVLPRKKNLRKMRY